MSETLAPCPGCGTYGKSTCVCEKATQVELLLGKGFDREAGNVVRGLHYKEFARLTKVLQYRAHDRGYQMGLKEGGPRGGNG